MSIPIALFFKVNPKGWSTLSIFPDLPFMHQMGLTFLLTVVLMLVISHKDNKGGKDEKGIELEKKLFITHPSFNIVAFIILLLLTGIYTLLW